MAADAGFDAVEVHLGHNYLASSFLSPRLNDGVAGGFWLDEAIVVAQWLERAGSGDALEMTEGSSLLNPMYLFKGDAPIEDFARYMPEPVKTGTRLFGARFLKTSPYSDGYFLQDARQVRAAVALPMVLLGGITNRLVIDQAMTDGFQFVAMPRALLREPDLIKRMQREPGTRSLCIHCNKCMTTIFASGTRCVLVPEETR